MVQTFPKEKLTIRPNVELDECNKLCIHDFSLGPSRVRSKGVFVKTNTLTLVKLGQMAHLMTSNEKKFEYKVVRDHQDLHFIYCPFFHLDNFEPILITFL